MVFYTMPQKIQPIRIQESRFIFDGITSNLPIMRRGYVALTVFSMAGYKMVIQRSLILNHGISQFSIVFSWYIDSPKTSCVYREDARDSWDIPRYTTWKRSITKLCYAEVTCYLLVVPLKALVPISNGWNSTTLSKKQRQGECNNYKRCNKSLLLNSNCKKNYRGLIYLWVWINFSFFLSIFSNKPIMMVLHKSWCQISQGKFFMCKQQ